MVAKASLRDYQRDLAERLREAKGAGSASKLGLQVADEGWLLDLGEAGEVIPVPPVTAVPLTRPWFKGVANIRGNLCAVIDFAGFLGRGLVTANEEARLLLLGERFRLGAGLLVERSLGLRNPAQLHAQEGSSANPPWVRAEYRDADGRCWKELDVAKLIQDPDFMAPGA